MKKFLRIPIFRISPNLLKIAIIAIALTVVGASYSQFLPCPSNCRVYFVCDDGVAVLHSCPVGLYFCGEFETCTWPWDSECLFNCLMVYGYCCPGGPAGRCDGDGIVIGTSFRYDASGNRIGRRTIILRSSAAMAGAMLTTAGDEHINLYGQQDFGLSPTLGTPENILFNNFYADRLNESDVIIFPNPTRGALAVEIRNMNPNIAHQITVLSLNGLIVFRKDNIGNFTEIDLSSHPRGVYLLRISSADWFSTWTIIKE